MIATIAALVVAWSPSMSSADDPPPSASAGMFDPSDPVFAAENERARKEAQEQRREDRSAATERAREESEDEFADLSDPAATRLAVQTFPDLLTGAPEAFGELTRGLRIKDFTSDTTAQVVTATGKPYGLMQTTAPMTSDSAGKDPIDLGLQPTDRDDFAPADPKIPLRLPGSADEPAELTNAGISFAPVGADAASATEREDRLFYASIDTDTDYVLKATELGAEAFWQLRSAESPQSLRLRYTLPAGARLVEQADLGDVAMIAIVDANNATIGLVKPVAAVDAAGKPVKVATRIDGTDLVIDVDHRDQDVQYPLLVDPITEGWSGGNWCNGGPSGGWSGERIGSAPDNYWSRACYIDQAGYGYGAWLGAYAGAPFGQGSTYQWNWYAPSNTYISDAALNRWRHLNVYGTYGYSGIFQDGVGWMPNSFRQSFYGQEPTWVEHHHGNLQGNRFVMGLNFHTTVYSQGALTGTDAVSLVLRDGQAPDAPTITADTPSSVVRSDGVKEYAWSTAPTLQFNTNDIGLGTRAVAVQRDNGTFMWGPFYLKSNGTWTADGNQACVGNRANPCPKGTVTSPYSVYYALNEGDNYGTLIAWDAGGRYTYGRRINARYSPYPMSAKYGGDDSRITTDAERAAYFAGEGDAESDNVVEMHPDDRAAYDAMWAAARQDDDDSAHSYVCALDLRNPQGLGDTINVSATADCRDPATTGKVTMQLRTCLMKFYDGAGNWGTSRSMCREAQSAGYVLSAARTIPCRPTGDRLVWYRTRARLIAAQGFGYDKLRIREKWTKVVVRIGCSAPM